MAAEHPPPTVPITPVAIAHAAVAAGVDTHDDAAVQRWLDAFYDKADDEQQRVLAAASGAVVPVRPLPTHDVLLAMARAVPAMVHLRVLLRWIGDGRLLTGDNRLTPADRAALVPAVRAGGDRPSAATAADAGPAWRTAWCTSGVAGIDLAFEVAVAARLVRCGDGVVTRTRHGDQLLVATGDAPPDARDGGPAARGTDGDAAQLWAHVVDAAIAAGVATGGRHGPVPPPWWHPCLDDITGDLTSVMVIGDHTLPLEEIMLIARDEVLAIAAVLDVPEAQRTTLAVPVMCEARLLIDRLSWLGVVRDQPPQAAAADSATPAGEGQRVALSELGRWREHVALPARGVPLVTLGSHRTATATELVDAIATWPPWAVADEVRAWADARDDAAESLVAAAVTAATHAEVRRVFRAVHGLGDHAVPAVRTAVAHPVLRPFAVNWLTTYGAEPDGAWQLSDDPAALVRCLAVVQTGLGTDAMHAVLHDADPACITALEGVWQVDDPYTAPLLEELAQSTDRRVAKAARRARFKLRNSR